MRYVSYPWLAVIQASIGTGHVACFLAPAACWNRERDLGIPSA